MVKKDVSDNKSTCKWEIWIYYLPFNQHRDVGGMNMKRTNRQHTLKKHWNKWDPYAEKQSWLYGSNSNLTCTWSPNKI